MIITDVHRRAGLDEEQYAKVLYFIVFISLFVRDNAAHIITYIMITVKAITICVDA